MTKYTLEADPKPVLDPTDPDLARKVAAALAAGGHLALAAAVVSCTDSGVPNGGAGGGNLVLVTTANAHGLSPGDPVVLAGTAYDGPREVADVVNVAAFYLLDTPFAAPSVGGTWSPA
jgi:hypothetical protein